MKNIIEFIKKIYLKYETIILYVFFGGLTTLVSFSTHFLVRYLDGSVIVATTISWICAVLFAFFTNRIWVFKSSTKGILSFIRQLLTFFGARLFSFLVELCIMWVFVDLMELNELIVKIGANVIVLVLNYILSKLVVFRKKNDSPKSE